jgi:hypothetical protein
MPGEYRAALKDGPAVEHIWSIRKRIESDEEFRARFW